MKRKNESASEWKRRHREEMKAIRRFNLYLERNPDWVKKKLLEAIHGPHTVEELRECDIEHGVRVARANSSGFNYDLRL